MTVHPLQEHCNTYCQGTEHMILVESPGPASIEYMAQTLGYTVVHVVEAWEVDHADFRRQLAYTFDGDTGLWSAYTPEPGPVLPIWRVHLAPAVPSLPVSAPGPASAAGPRPGARFSRLWRVLHWLRP